ncbi:MAG: hypothetical protein HZB65_04065 [Candidatus Aenigmarchaeota archaeon]|nr:hypothetical protein [Candidatus Aenigmarchaeota archaeon]
MLADKAFLETLLKFIGKKLKHETECLIIGGNAMLYYDLRGQTKDIDMVFFKKQDIGGIMQIIKSHPLYRNIKPTRKLPYHVTPALAKKGTPIFIGDKDVPRFDLFYRNVFSIDAEKMFNDSDKTIVFDMLKIRLPKPEYIILMKAATDRPQDKEDIIRLVKNLDIDWKKFLSVMKECKSERAVFFALENLYFLNKKNDVKEIVPKSVLDECAKIFGLHF